MGFWKGKKGDDGESSSSSAAIATPKSPIAPLLKEAVDELHASTPTASSAGAGAPVAPPPKVHSALGPGTIIQGRLSFDTPVSIDGKLSGEVVSSDTLYIGRTGVVDATIRARELVVEGQASGSFIIRERLIVRAGGSLSGVVVAPRLVVEEGALFNADCSPEESSTRPPQFKSGKESDGGVIAH